MNFSIGDSVVVSHPYVIDYRDVGGKKTTIPAGSFGTVISPRNEFHNGVRIAVCFANIENYDCLWYKSREIGPGHYIGEDYLEPYLEEIDDFKDFDSMSVLFG